MTALAPVEVGTQVADFKLLSTEGKEASLSSLLCKNGIVLGFLHGTYCAACMQQLTRANRYTGPLDAHDVAFVWILDDSPDNIASYALASDPPPRYQLMPDLQPSVSRRFGLYHESAFGGGPQPSLLYLDPQLAVRFLFAPENPHDALDLNALLRVVEDVVGAG